MRNGSHLMLQDVGLSPRSGHPSTDGPAVGRSGDRMWLVVARGREGRAVVVFWVIAVVAAGLARAAARAKAFAKTEGSVLTRIDAVFELEANMALSDPESDFAHLFRRASRYGAAGIRISGRNCARLVGTEAR